MRIGDCVNYIEAIPRFTEKHDLAHTRALLDALGNPERGLRFLHVAGTNGKGSVCAYLQAMLTAGGFRTATFTSPHLERINERFAIDGECVDDEAFVRCFQEVAAAVERRQAEGDAHPTYFEFLFLMGIVRSARQMADFVILETGLGGRLDATNVIEKPEVAIITSIGLDHTRYLGGTILEIAREKAGIIKADTPVIFDGENAEAAAVIRRTADSRGSHAIELTPEAVTILENGPEGQRFLLETAEESFKLTIRQRAPYQARNAALAFLALREIRPAHGLSDAELARGLSAMSWPARMEEILPDVIIDGAHNREAAERFAQAARELFPGRPATLLFAAAADKPWEEMTEVICRALRPRLVVATSFTGGRAVPAEELAARCEQAGAECVLALPDTGEAYERAMEEKKEGVLYVVGSLYLAGEIRARIRENKENCE